MVPASPVKRTTRTGAELRSASQLHKCGATMRVSWGSVMTTPMSSGVRPTLSRYKLKNGEKVPRYAK